MEFLTTNINDIFSYILLGIIYLFHFITNRMNRTNSMLFKNDMIKKVDGTTQSVQEGINNTQSKVEELARKIEYIEEASKKEVDELRVELNKEREENKKLKEEFLRSVKHSDELCKRGVTKQIRQNLKDEEGK